MVSSSDTAPLTTSDCDCTDLDGFMLNVERLMSSELAAGSSHEVVAAALFLWCRAWKQQPAASLPDDDKVNAAFAKLPMARFKKLKAEILRGFVKCSDGRLYHRVLAVEATKAFAKKTAYRGDVERKRKEREDRSRIFEALGKIGIVPSWNVATSELRKLERAHLAQDDHADVTVTCHVTGHVTGHKPDTAHVTAIQGQGQVLKEDSSSLRSEAPNENSVATVPARTPTPVYADAKHELWADGARMLFELGVPKSQAKSLIGKWMKETGDCAPAVFDAIQRARVIKPINPISWIVRALQSGRASNDSSKATNIRLSALMEIANEERKQPLDHDFEIAAAPSTA